MAALNLRMLAISGALALLLGALGIVSFAAAATGGPSVTLTTTSGSTTNASIPVTATFSSPVIGFNSAAIIATNATISNFSGSGTTYTFTVDPVFQSGTSTITVSIPADVAIDASTTGNVASNILTFTYDPDLLSVSGVNVTGITTSGATITWDTNIPTTGQVNYGTTTSFGSSTPVETTASTTHSASISGLDASTTYSYQIAVADGSNNTASSSVGTFTTSGSTPTPLSVTGTDAVRTNATADNQYADGWQWVMHLTVPTNEDAFRIRFGDWSNTSSSFATAGNVRVYSAQSSNASSADSAITESDNGYSGWLYLSGDTTSSTDGRQIDLVIDVKIPSGTANGSYTSTYTAQSWPSSATSTAPSTP